MTLVAHAHSTYHPRSHRAYGLRGSADHVSGAQFRHAETYIEVLGGFVAAIASDDEYGAAQDNSVYRLSALPSGSRKST
ncbi:hypothetical protein BKA03_002955 [Demequina lutea]|uniref:Uncharacterized protein n=1 Tax=Demequina lutea TaxID=431489 RepID=A0A7Y9ZGA9_9MICO|nr:hypothetical protein [Demequina lutea]